MNGRGETLALSAKHEDKYAPRKTGLYDIVITKWTGKDTDNVD